MEKCVICKDLITDETAAVTLREKGCIGILKASKERGECFDVQPGQHAHVECRRIYCHPKEIQKAAKRNDFLNGADDCKPKLRSSESKFNFREHCLFCGKPASLGQKCNKRGFDTYPVRTKDFDASIKFVCKKRDDQWSEEVMARIMSAPADLHASDAIYHQVCSVNFRTGRNSPNIDQTEGKKVGRPESDVQSEAFLKVVEHLTNNDDEQITVYDLIDKMENFLEGSGHSAYTYKWMKSKLEKHFGDKITITEINGKTNVVTFKRTAAIILHEYHMQSTQDPETEKNIIISTAAELIKSDIKSILPDNQYYPVDDLCSLTAMLDYLPDSLKSFLGILLCAKNAQVKSASLGQALMQAVRPRILTAPLQIGLGVQLHHHFGSRFLIDTLHSLGFSSSYAEVQRFERSAAVSNGVDLPLGVEGGMIQLVADNVDHNLVTLDGKNTFHGMGIIATITPEVICKKYVPKKNVTAAEIAAVGKIDINFYKNNGKKNSLKYELIKDFIVEDATSHIDLLWKITWPLKSPRPLWSGMMQMLHVGNHPGKSSVIFLPMIDMDPSDLSCVYSTLKFACKLGNEHGFVPVITFDQPLWWKATLIKLEKIDDGDLKEVILRLGGLHVIMSFLGSIGHIMSDSGLYEVLEQVYASNVVVHMLSGKAIARAIRGHFLVETALFGLICDEVFHVPLPVPGDTDVESGCTKGEEYNDREMIAGDNHQLSEIVSSENEGSAVEKIDSDLLKAGDIFDKLFTSDIGIQDISICEDLEKVSNKLEIFKERQEGRTAKLWFIYLQMLDILRRFIKAERTGNWQLHLSSVSEMLPFFAASGHNHYTKSVMIYLKMMQSLSKDSPGVHQQFCRGLHVVRRSERYWAGLSTDLIIEQVLMRSVKTTGGLTRGRGMTENQRLVWLLSMPACAEVNNSMQELTETRYATSMQHKDLSKTRLTRDETDSRNILNFLVDRNPFSNDTSLHNIATGIIADGKVNVDEAESVGNAILKSMSGKQIDEYVHKRKEQVVTMGKNTLKCDKEAVQIDPQLLFQRLVTVARSEVDDLEPLMNYELCSYPQALFEAPNVLRKANKPALTEVIMKMVTEEGSCCPDSPKYVLDGGALVQRVPWQRGASFGDICKNYVHFVVQRYANATVVFDGYANGPSTKDVTHNRRTQGKIGPFVNFTAKMPLRSKKEEFLNNKCNKQNFINMLSDVLKENGVMTIHADGDADLRIVMTAVNAAECQETVVIGEDTDLLMLLLHHANTETYPVFLKSEPKQNSTSKSNVFDIHKIKTVLGDRMCRLILPIHASLGCDTTSRIFGIGKGVAFKKALKDTGFGEALSVFNDERASSDDIILAGETLVVQLFGGKPQTDLNGLRYKIFCQKVARCNAFVESKSLPPTKGAMKYHSFRVYYQVQEWKGNEDLNPTDWGWKKDGDCLLPNTTDLPHAPKDLLEVIRCNCRKDCNTLRCTCKKNGLECSTACGHCHGTNCMNSVNTLIHDEAFEDEEPE